MQQLDRATARRRLAIIGAAFAVVGIVMFLLLRPHPDKTEHVEEPLAAPPSLRFTHNDGEGIYKTVCQTCHMPDGKGAVGAGRYPSLAANPALEDGAYPATLIVGGRAAMPAVGQYMSDEQVAAVVNYVRTHFGNNYTTPLRAQDVAPLRQAAN